MGALLSSSNSHEHCPQWFFCLKDLVAKHEAYFFCPSTCMENAEWNCLYHLNLYISLILAMGKAKCYFNRHNAFKKIMSISEVILSTSTATWLNILTNVVVIRCIWTKFLGSKGGDTTIPGLKSCVEYDLCFLLLWDLKDPDMFVWNLQSKNMQVITSFFFQVCINMSPVIPFRRKILTRTQMATDCWWLDLITWHLFKWINSAFHVLKVHGQLPCTHGIRSLVPKCLCLTQ